MPTNLTQNLNYLSPLGFKLAINNQIFANVEYFCVSVSLPGINLPEVPVPFRGSQHAVSGDRIDYPFLDIRFIVSENMENYLEMYNWIKRTHANDKPEVHDATLSILSSHQRVTRQIRYTGIFPVAMDSFEMNVQSTDVDYVTCGVTFRYTYHEFAK